MDLEVSRTDKTCILFFKLMMEGIENKIHRGSTILSSDSARKKSESI